MIDKINQAIPGYFDAETLRDLTGIKGTDNALLDTGVTPIPAEEV